MTQQHPITPPPELVQQWRAAASNVPATLSTDSGGRHDYIDFIANRAAQWGADAELEACCALMDDWGLDGEDLMLCRRPKPPSLKEQAMQALCRFMASEGHEDCTEEEVADDFTTIRRALEQLPDNEPSGNSR